MAGITPDRDPAAVVNGEPSRRLAAPARRRAWIHVFVAAGLMMAACTAGPAPETAPSTSPSPALIGTTPSTTTASVRSTTTAPVLPATTVPDDRAVFIARTVESMSLREKVAQLLMVEFSGSDGSIAIDLLERVPIGGVLLKSANGNLVSSAQLRELTDRLQSERVVPLLVAVDQEGGRIDRVRFEDVQRFPSARTFGVLNDPALTEQAAWATGIQLAALGINAVFAPVADVNVLGDDNPAIGDRAYGSDPALVARMTVAAVAGFERAGVAAAAKHFPGHGNTAVDSHLGLPVVRADVDLWSATDLVPFEAAVAAGVPMVMVAHVAYPALDAESLPASMSRAITTGQLRESLRFGGVIVTDDLANMQAVAAWDPGERAVRALAAGSDLLLNPGDVDAAVSAIVAAVEVGRVSVEQVEAALGRVLGLKYDLGSDGVPYPLDPSTTEAVATVASKVAAACVGAGLDC